MEFHDQIKLGRRYIIQSAILGLVTISGAEIP
jgi:hypothetical protein